MTIRLQLFHFEDEPHDVQFPSLLDTAIGRLPDVTDCNMTSNNEETAHSISFRYKSRDVVVDYLLPDSLDGHDQATLTGAVLHVADLSLDGNPDQGVKLVRDLSRHGVPTDSIWMITGYALRAQSLFAEWPQRPRIIAKPAPPTMIRDEMLALILKRIEERQ